MFLIGLTGRAGVGKDTAGTVLVNRLGFTRFAFADPIKLALSAMLGLDKVLWNDREWKERPLPGQEYSPRFLAQTLGTEWGRQLVHPQFWIHATESLIHQSGAGRVVITDVRFDNEAEWIQRQGGWVIELRRDDVTSVQPHVSEAGVAPQLVDFTIVNNSARTIFENQVEFEVNAKIMTAALL